MSSFRGAGRFLLLEGDTNVPFKWELDVSENVSDNKFIPYGMDATNVVVTVEDADGDPITSIVQTVNLADNIITCLCNYPTEGVGTYTVKFAITLNNAAATVRNANDNMYAELNE